MVPVAIHGLSKSFGKTEVLRRIDLQIEAGELFFLLGPSGCGKTTLLRHIAGFLHPDAGTIFFGEREVSRVPAHRRDTAMMFQSYALWPHLSVAENVAFGLKERKTPKPEIDNRVREALDLVEMGHLGTRAIAALSGGQQQRVALARALVVRPKILLLDEPLSNLDARLRLSMRREIRRLVKDFGLTAIYVTHDQDEALSMADRMAVMDHGEIAQLGTPQEIYRRPTSRVVAHFIGETNFLAARVVSRHGSRARVATALGEFAAETTAATATSQPGEEVLLSVRPECLHWAGAVEPAAELPGESTDRPTQHPHAATQGTLVNEFQAQITTASYLGSQASYELNTARAESPALQLLEANPRGLHPSGPAWRRIRFAPEDACLIPLDAASPDARPS